MCDLCDGSKTSVPSFGELAQPLDAGLVDLDRGVHARGRLVDELIERGDGGHVERRLHLAQHRRRAGRHDGPLGRSLARHVGDDLLELRAANHLVAQAVRGLPGGPNDRAPLALEAAQQRVREPAHEHVVPGAVAFAVEELGEVDRLAGAQRHVPPVGQELADRPDAPGPLARPEDGIGEPAPARPGASRPDEDLRDEQDAPGAPALHVEERANEMIALDAPARTSRRQDPRPALEEERRARPARDGTLEIAHVRIGAPRSHRVEPAAPHRLEDPEAEVVREADLRQLVALRQVVEREEVDERQIAQDVDDGAASIGVADGARPRLVDLDALEEAMVDPGEERVRLVRDERAVLLAHILHRPWKTRWAIDATFLEESGVTPVCGYGQAKLKAWTCSHESETRTSAGVGAFGWAIAKPNSANMQFDVAF